jgi:predicted ATP-grasp superfamily ATP-dependent carboligase
MPLKEKVLVVGAEENPSLPLIESLSTKEIEVHVASHRRVCLGFFSKYAHSRFLCPSPYTDEQDFLAALCDYVKKENFAVTFVVGDRATDLLVKYKDLFAKYTNLPLVDFEQYVNCRDKTRTMQVAQRIGIPTPKTYYPGQEPVEKLAKNLSYPVVLKPNTSDGARGISYPNDAEELTRLYQPTVAAYGDCHIQEYIPHTGNQYKAELLLDRDSEVKAWCVYNKLRYYPPTGGSSTLNSTVSRRDILECAATILKELKWYGMADCDYIEDPRDGTAKLMEINPRFTRSIKICVLAGVDFPYLLYKAALGEPVPSVMNYRNDVFLRYLPADIAWFLKSKDRFTARPSFFWFFGKNLSDEIISLNDPGPAIAYCFSKISARRNKTQRHYNFNSLTKEA